MNANRVTRMGALLAVLVACVGCDQVTKSIATRTLAPLPPQLYLGGFLRLEYARNPGAFLGMGGNLSPQQRFWFLTIVNAVAMLVLGYVLVTRWNMPRVRFAAWALVLAGGIGNLIDRVWQQGLVTDFLNLRIGPFRTGIFNVADMAIRPFRLFLGLVSRRAETAGSRRAVIDGTAQLSLSIESTASITTQRRGVIGTIIRGGRVCFASTGRSGGAGGGCFQFHWLWYETDRYGVATGRLLSVFEMSRASSVPLVSSVRSTGQAGLPVCIISSIPCTRNAKCIKGRASCTVNWPESTDSS